MSGDRPLCIMSTGRKIVGLEREESRTELLLLKVLVVIRSEP